MLLLLGLSESPKTASFTRSGSDQLEAASLAAGESLSFSYEAGDGQMTEIAGSGENGFRLELGSDALLHLPVSQTVTESGETLLSAAITYDAGGLRASRTVRAGSEGQGSSTTSYWYGGALHPLVITRDGVTYRLIGKEVVEAVGSDSATRSYLQADRLGSVRMVTDDQGRVVQSLGYDDYGFTRIQGQSAAASFDSMASFYRFQGQEQEVFPLARLGIEDDALAQWLDEIQLYHFPWRDYGAGFAAFTQTDPVPTEDSLYSAFAANPVNSTDETGGMINADDYFPLRYNPAHRIIAPRLQNLLDRLEGDPEAFLTRLEILDLRRLQVAIYSQHNNPNNPFAPDHWILGEWRESSNTYSKRLVPITEERIRQAEQDFIDLRREQNDWLQRYSTLIVNRWYRERRRTLEEEKKIEFEQPTTQNWDTDEDVNDAPLNSSAADGSDGLPPDQQVLEEKEELDQKEEPAQASEPSERLMPRSEDVEENRSGKCCCCIL
jgi:hypothetical protein